MSATVWFIPDAHPETTTVDGYVERNAGSPGDSWSALRNGAGTSANDSSTTAQVLIYAQATQNLWLALDRIVLLYNTTTLLPSYNILAAWLSCILVSKSSQAQWASFALGVVASSPASNVQLVAADYSCLGVTLLSDTKLLSAIPEKTLFNLTLNASGIMAINKGGITKLGVRETAYDLANSAPPWVTNGNARAWLAMAGHISYQPVRLYVTYEVGIPRSRSFIID